MSIEQKEEVHLSRMISCCVCDQGISEHTGTTIKNCPGSIGMVHLCDDCLKEFGANVGNLIIRITDKFERRFLEHFGFEFPKQF